MKIKVTVKALLRENDGVLKDELKAVVSKKVLTSWQVRQAKDFEAVYSNLKEAV